MRHVSFLADNAYAGGLDYDWRLSPMYSISGYFAGTHIKGNTEAITAPAGKQRPRLPAPRRRLPRRGRRLRRRCSGHAGSVSFGKISGESTRFSSYVGYKSPGLRHQRSRLHAPRRRAQPVELVPVAQLQAGQVRAHAQLQHQPVRRLELRRRPPYSGGNINSHWTFTNYYSIGGGFNLDAAPFRDRVTRGGPGVLGNPSKQPLVLREHRQPQGAVVLLQRRPLGRHQEQRAPRHHARASTGARPRRCR